MYIGGEWVAGTGGNSFETLNPGTGQRLATVAAGDAGNIDRAVQSARNAFEKSGWATMPPNDRAVLLHRLADLIEKRAELLSELESLDVGKPRAQALGFDIPHSAKTFRYY